jgi:malate dehydrogenase
MARPRISLIGAGQIGGVMAQLVCQKQLADVMLFDVVDGLPQGKALDINHALDAFGSDCVVTGTNAYEDTAGTDVYIVTAGIPRKPGMSRDDLLATNIGIIRQVASGIAKASPDACVIVVSNPLDAMVYAMKQLTGFPKERVFGQAGVLDSARFKFFVAQELGVSVRDVNALVLGGHGDTMVPLPRHCSVNGVPLLELMDRKQVDAIVERVQGAGGEVVGLLKTGSAFVSPAAASVAMAESVILDQKRVLPCAAFLDGEYGASGIYMGVPVVIGAGGAERILELELNAEESEAMQKTIAHVEKLVGELEL